MALNLLEHGERTLEGSYKLPAGVALHGLSLTIPGVVVGASALVASGRTWSARKASPEASTTYKASPRRHDGPSAASNSRATLEARVGTRALGCPLAWGWPVREITGLRQDDQAVHKYSNAHLCLPRLFEG